MLFVIDTSTLILLRKLGWLDMCCLGDTQLIWPPRVTQELKQRKQANKAVLELLATKTVAEVAIRKPITFAELSATDAEVISLAAESTACILSEDKELRSKASRLGVSQMSLAVFTTLLYQLGLFSNEECLTRLQKLHEAKLLSKSDYHLLLQGIMS